MKLSEAIRKGSDGRGQLFGNFIDERNGEVCLLGAAYIGTFGETGLQESDDILYELLDAYDCLCGGEASWGDIAHWNDHEKLTFEQAVERLEDMGL